ncbi:MAG: hypothetical protein ABIP35_00015 [Ginsengibacter sp.]
MTINKKQLYFYSIICYAILALVTAVRLVDNIQKSDSAKIMGSIIILVCAIGAFISFFFLYKKEVKNSGEGKL